MKVSINQGATVFKGKYFVWLYNGNKSTLIKETENRIKALAFAERVAHELDIKLVNNLED